jgi:hypothetical protein
MKKPIYLPYNVQYENQHCFGNINQVIYKQMFLVYM